MLTQKLIDEVVKIAEKAANEIMKVYEKDEPIDVKNKSDDSPLTLADLASHKTICEELASVSEYPILSEESEGISAQERLSWTTYWLIDPLDGTKEFVARNGEFTVNIALIHEQQVVLGVVYVPVTKDCYLAAKDLGAFKIANNTKQQIQTRSLDKQIEAHKKLEIVGSRRHGAEALEKLMATIETELASVELVSKGSSLKFCLLAEGKADLYPRLALTCEWDTAAAQIIVEEAGGCVLTPDLLPMRYNTKEELLNPFFWVLADNPDRWKPLLKIPE